MFPGSINKRGITESLVPDRFLVVNIKRICEAPSSEHP